MNFNEFIEAYRFDPQRDLINEGGFGKVYRAWGEHDREVAIKVCQVQNHKYTLKHEFELAAKLSKHPNIAFYENVYDFDIPGIGKTEYAVMQYYPDGDLRNVIANKTLEIEEKTDILAGIISGVAFLHQSGIIHRDLKPGNILMQKVQSKWRPKITDFGLGKAFSGNGEISNTSAGIVSLLYASPEQILGDPTLPNTDLWPIGIITYLLFTGKLPFESDFPKETESYRADVSKKIVAGIVPDDIESLPEPFKTICKKCLIVDNSKRIQSAGELLPALFSLNATKCTCDAETKQDVLFYNASEKQINSPKNAVEKEISSEKTISTPIETRQNGENKTSAQKPKAIINNKTTGPKLKSRKRTPVYVWIIFGLFALGAVMRGGFSLLKNYKSSSDYSSSSNSSSDDPFEGMSDFEINAAGESYYSDGEYKNAKKYFKKGADNGYTPAIRNLGIYYLAYEGDYSKAFNYLTEAADDGDSDAEINLRNMYNKGQVYGYVSNSEANNWYNKLF